MDIQYVVIDDFNPDEEKLLARLGLDGESDERDDFLALLDKMKPLARPKGAIASVEVDIIDPAGAVRLGGVEFESRLLADNLKDIHVAWPYIATCGRELYGYVMAMPDPFERYWGEEIMQQGLTDIRAAMERFTAEKIYPGKTATMGPGSLPEWPIGQQVPLFRLMREAAERCGVTLTDTLLMLPNKSVSGVRFPNEHGFVSCRLCPRENCPNRRAKYEPTLAGM